MAWYDPNGRLLSEIHESNLVCRKRVKPTMSHNASHSKKERISKMAKGLPSPGDIVQYDFRGSETLQASESLKIVQWNIERGYKLPEIIEDLRKLDPDVIGLQEIDIHCERSGNLDVGLEIAKALEMNYTFLCEFLELKSKARSERDQGGGVHGNAILTKFDFSTVEAVRHSHHPIDWETNKHPKTKAEPRKGERMTLCAVLNISQIPLVVYSCHLEVFCGISHRLYQFSDILKDSRCRLKAGFNRQVILGDLNTIADRFARCLPLFCTDHLRFKTIGIREATFWKENLFQVQDASLSDLRLDETGLPMNRRLLFWGLDPSYCRHLINPGFYDPFDTNKDITLQEPKIGPFNLNLVAGKLDWLLVRDMKIVNTEIGNHDYAASDHKWLMATVLFLSSNI